MLYARDTPPPARGVWYHAETVEEMSRLVGEVMEHLPDEDGSAQPKRYGRDAWFCFSDLRFEHPRNPGDEPDTLLRLAVNRSTGFGALMWLVTRGRSSGAGDEVDDYLWISDNPQPPEFDPRVIAEPGYVRFHSRRSAVPLERVRVVLEEFCRVGTGARPESISWVRGELNGQRSDEEPIVDWVEAPETNPWDEAVS